MRTAISFSFLFTFVSSGLIWADDAGFEKLVAQIRELDSKALDDADELKSLVRDEQRRQLFAANAKSSAHWSRIKTREQWEEFSRARIDALRRSLGKYPDPPKKLNVRVTGRIQGDGFRVENLMFESRPGLWVTANLYLPAKPTRSMPGIILSHSHHRPKEHGELQDMGMTWARAGCVVLVPDHLGHGERRQHAFVTDSDYKGEFRVSRQDYYFRYDTGMQLHLVGDSLMGWLAWDLMRGVDLLLSRDGVDPKRIALLGAVAGGGDPCAVAAAIDERITCAVPFNFGGPQPETRFPLPDDAETSFNYAGSGSWESTRNISFSARHGFLPWVIVSSIAPRRLVFAHEFTWDRPRDPVWKRLQSIYKLYEASENLAFTHGRGELRGRPPEATHCTHIGRPHRVLIHAAFKKWFNIDVDPAKDEYSQRLPSEKLRCNTTEVEREVHPKKLHEILSVLAAKRVEKARAGLEQLAQKDRAGQLRQTWSDVLGNERLQQKITIHRTRDWEKLHGGATARRFRYICHPSKVQFSILWLVPPYENDKKIPAVLAIAQGGKEAFLRHRSKEIAQLLAADVAVGLPDLRGIGELRGGNDRGRYSGDTSRSSTELMLGGTMVGSRLHDLLHLMNSIAVHPFGFVDQKRIALWGDSFAEVNPRDLDFKVPRRVDNQPKQCEPLGGVLALLGALHDDDVKAVYIHGGLAAYQTTLNHWRMQIPHDAVIPGATAIGDLPQVAAALAPRPLRMDALVDGLNRHLTKEDAAAIYQPAVKSYREADAQDAIIMGGSKMDSPAEWLIATLKQNQ